MLLPVEIENRMDAIRSEIERAGAELIEVHYRRSGNRGVLTFLVDKPGGITLEECAVVNQRLGAHFDGLEDGFLQGAYFLEVNSPGLDRPLKTPRDYERAVGQTLRVQTRDERGVSAPTVAKLTGVSPSGIELEVRNEKRSVKFEDIFKATRDAAWKK